MNAPNHNQFDTCVVTRVDSIHMPRYCKNLNHISSTISVVQWSKAPAWKAKVAGSISGGGIFFHFEFSLVSTL